MITLILHKEKVLTKPYLYLSLYLKQNHKNYYEHLQRVRKTGDWESWIEFFLKGVEEVSHQGVATAQKLLKLLEKDKKKISDSSSSSQILIFIYEIFAKHICANTRILTRESGKPLSSVLRSVKKLQELGIVKEISNSKRNQIFIYKEFFEILEKETNF